VTISTQELPQFIKDLLSMPPRRGGGLNQWIFKVARYLHAYRDQSEIIALLKAVTLGEPIKHGEIERAVANSAVVAWRPGETSILKKKTAWPKVNQEQREAVIASGRELVDLWGASQMRLDDSCSHTEEIIDALFPGDPLLCCGASNSKFATRARSHWRGKLAELQFIVPSPMTLIQGITKEGRKSQHTLSNTGPRHYLVIEQDSGTIDEQAAILWHLAEKIAPLALVVHSGSKSIHGWFYCKGLDESRLRVFMHKAITLGADPATWTRSQFVRMPDGMRDNKIKQTAYLFNPEVIK